MKTFDDLNGTQKEEALGVAFYDLTNMIRDGVLEVKLVNPDSQKRLEMILTKGRKSEQPRLIVLYILNDKPIRQEIERLALVVAHGADYDVNGDAIKEVDVETAKRIVG